MKKKEEYIEVRKARVNNLKNIDIDIPRDKLIVVTGVSGSGKSSLAFDTLYAEGQRRYVESLSSYARQFLGRLNKPACDSIKGLPPAIAIEQKVVARNPRSTVGSSTEIYEHLRLLYAKIGKTFSPISGQEVKKHSINDIIAQTKQFADGTKFVVLCAIRKDEHATFKKQLETLSQEGYSRLWKGNEAVRIDDLLDDKALLKNGKIDDYELLIARTSVSNDEDAISRLYDSLETAFYEGNGSCSLVFLPACLRYQFSNRFEADGITFEEPNENLFSYNSPTGACPTCNGFGNIIGIDERLVVPDTMLSVYNGCVQCWHGDKMGEWKTEFCRRAALDHFPIFKPYYELSFEEKDQLWHGLPSEKHLDIREQICIDAFFQFVKDNQYKIQYRVMLSRYRGKTVCPDCHGTRLKKQATWVKINGKSITDLIQMPIDQLALWFQHLELPDDEAAIAKRPIQEIEHRLQYLIDVGLGYLTLNRTSNTLSGGEAQRINLTTAIGSPLIGSLYILDEPSIGLHPRDTQKLISVIQQLKAIGNTVVVVEHDEEMMRAADQIIDIGPNAGIGGGEVVWQGSPKRLPKDKKKIEKSYTLRYLTGETQPIPLSRRSWNQSIILKGCRANNLKGIDAQFPLNVLTVVTGVSGSGKSTLVTDTLYPALKRHLGDVADMPGEYSALEGDWQQIKHVELVDQNPIGKSTRSNPATYVKAFDAIRQLFSEQPLAQQMQFPPQFFSFNAEGGRCEECKGAGVITVEMQFMADLQLPCESCHGKRFKHDILEVEYKGKNINDVLNLSVDQAIAFFGENNQKEIVKRLQPLHDVGLGYILIGQSSATLSGGENQRVKLAYFLSQEKSEPTLFIFDEPTTGLHYHDIQQLIKAFNALIERGHTIIVIEHNTQVILQADHIIDIGPDGGEKGGEIVCAGTPEQVAACKKSYTGKFLKEQLK